MEHKIEKEKKFNSKLTLFEIYRGSRKGTPCIVFLGDSLTSGAEWTELLGRCDIANRGIGGDTTNGMLLRISDVIKLTPKICFFMGGTNDLRDKISVDGVFENICEIIETLSQNNIDPIIQSVIFVSKYLPNWFSVNKKVDELNELIKHFCHEKDYDFLNLNQLLEKGGALDEQYTYDGIHLNGNGYLKWRVLIQSIIEKKLSVKPNF